MAQHVKILAVLHIIYAGLSALAGIVVLAILGGIARFLSANGDAVDNQVAPSFLAFLGVVACVLLVSLSLPGLIGGLGLLQFKQWARILVIVLSVFELLSIPFGTALGIYGLWVLLNRDSERLFPMRSVPAAPL